MIAKEICEIYTRPTVKKRHVAGIGNEQDRIFLSLSFSFSFAFLVVEIGVQRSVQMAVRDKKNFARIYRYWPIVIDAPPFPVQMGKIVFPFFFYFFFSLLFPAIEKEKERKVSIFQQLR